MFKNLLILFFGIVLAISLAFANDTPISCSQSKSIDFNATQLSGIWWEVARNPAPVNMFCVQVYVTVREQEDVFDISTTYSNTPNFLWVNQTMFASISLDSISPNGFNISYKNGFVNTPKTVFKLLDTDYKNYALICGYTNAADNTTSFGIILTRDRNPSIEILNAYEEIASSHYADFTNGTMSLITQSPALCGISA